jgi:hypothetical protein
MRTVIIGVVTGVCVCVSAIAILAAIDGYANPGGYPPGLLPGQPRAVAACFWALAYFGPLTAAVGALAGGILGGVGAGIGWAVNNSRCPREENGPADEPIEPETER